ncbi:MAG: hypothetical protein ACREJB_10940 [Planctomycetaceae bacterium]
MPSPRNLLFSAVTGGLLLAFGVSPARAQVTFNTTHEDAPRETVIMGEGAYKFYMSDYNDYWMDYWRWSGGEPYIPHFARRTAFPTTEPRPRVTRVDSPADPDVEFEAIRQPSGDLSTPPGGEPDVPVRIPVDYDRRPGRVDVRPAGALPAEVAAPPPVEPDMEFFPDYGEGYYDYVRRQPGRPFLLPETGVKDPANYIDWRWR